MFNRPTLGQIIEIFMVGSVKEVYNLRIGTQTPYPGKFTLNTGYVKFFLVIKENIFQIDMIVLEMK